MSNVIQYNGSDVFQDQPCPLISKSVSYLFAGDSRVLEQNLITLRGELTGCGIDDLNSARQSALNVFSDSFKDLYVSGVDTFTGVKIDSISFDESPYLQILPYTISLTHYPSGGFQIAHGVQDPVSEWSYTEGEDQTISITHNVSARGINTNFSQLGGNALDNAKDFVTGQLTGAWEIPRPYMIDTSNTNFKSFLTSFSESIDKLSNTISVTRNFSTDPKDLEGNVILRYTQQIEENEGQSPSITYNGTIDAGETGYIKYNQPKQRESSNLTQIRDRYDEFKDSLETTNFLSERVTEDTGINRLTFSLSFNSGDEEPSIIDDFTITVSENSDSSLFTVSINGNLSPKQGCIGTKFNDVSGAFQGDSHKFQICDEIYKDFYTSAHGSTQAKPYEVVLNTKPLSKNISYNQNQDRVSYTNNFDDRNLLQFQDDSNVTSFDYQMNFNPSVQAVVANPSVQGGYILQDLGYRPRASFSMSTNSQSEISSGDYIDFAKSQFNKMTEDPKDILQESNNYNVSYSKSSSSEYSRSFHSKYAILDIDTNYTGLNEFRL